MPTYRYRARDVNGTEQRGTIDSPSESEAAKVLRESNVFITEMQEEGVEKDAGKPAAGMFSGFKNKVRRSDILILTRQLAAMTASGIPIMTILKSLSEQIKNKRLKDMILGIRAEVEEGKSLSESMAKYPDAFSQFYTSMVKMGETAGNLDEIMNRIVNIEEKEMDIINKVKAAITYPAVLLVVALCVISFLLIFILPKFIGIFQTYETKLPLTTTVLLSTSLFVKQYWPVALIALILFGLWLHSYIRRPDGRMAFDRFMLKVPVTGSLVMKINISGFARSVSGLISSGITLIDALAIAEEATGNIVVRSALSNIRVSITEGRSFAKTMIETGLFPPTAIQMVAAGESTGRLDQMLWDLSRFYDSEVDSEIRAMTVMLEPALLIAMGGMVAFIALSVLLPIFNLIKVFRH
jgi:type II secretory pathway component PulF